MKTAILFTANTPQVAQSWLMTNTLLDPERGAFSGDVWVLSTNLTDACQQYLDDQGINYYISDLQWVWDEMSWQAMAGTNSEVNSKKLFQSYRNKRMSKLLYLDWFDLHGAEYDVIAIADNDLYFQADINETFACGLNNKFNYAVEHNPIVPGSSLWTKDFHYRRITNDWSYDGGMHEINIGFVVSTPKVMRRHFQAVKERFIALPFELIRDYLWHDQDLSRVERAKSPDMYQEFDPGTILHLCGGGMTCVEERKAGYYYNRETGEFPTIVHFGGKAWDKFDSIRRAYLVEPSHFLYKFLLPEAQAKIADKFKSDAENSRNSKA